MASKDAPKDPTNKPQPENSKQSSSAKPEVAEKMTATGRKAGEAAKKTPVLDLKAEEVKKATVTSKGAVPKTGAKTSAAPAAGKSEQKTVESKSTESSGAKDTADSPSVKVMSQKAPPQKSGGGFFRSLVAAIVGGIIAILGLIGVERFELADLSVLTGDKGNITQLDARVAELESDLSEQTSKAIDLAAVDALKQEVAELRTLVSTGGSGEDVALQSLSQSLEAVQSSSETGLSEVNETIAMLQQQISELEARKSEAGTSTGEGEQIAALSGEVTTLQEKFAELTKTIPPAGLETGGPAILPAVDTNALVAAAQEALRPEIKAAMNAAQAVADGQAELTAGFDEKISELDAKVTEVATSTNGLADQIPDMSELNASSSHAAAMVLAAQQLNSAVDTGGSFKSQLDLLQSHSASQTLTPLQPFAENGLPTLSSLTDKAAQLAKDFVVVAPAPKAAEEVAPTDKLLNNMLSVLKVKVPTNSDTPSGPSSEVIATLKSAIFAGDKEAVLSMIEQLGEGATAKFEPWQSEFEARLSAPKLMAEFQAALLNSLVGSTDTTSSATDEGATQ